MGRHRRSNHRPPPTSKFARVAASTSASSSSKPKLHAPPVTPLISSAVSSRSSVAQAEIKGSPGSPASEISSDPPSLIAPVVDVVSVALSSPASEISSAGLALATPVVSLVTPPDSPQLTETKVETKGSVFPSPIVEVHSSLVVTPASEISSAGNATVTPGSSSLIQTIQLSQQPQASEMCPKRASTVLPWATKFKSSLRNLKKMSPPTFLEDGTPVVVAPASVLLRSAEMWKGHIVAQFHGLCPPTKRIFNDLNPIWGRFGNITVRMISETASMIFIPSLATREWVLEVGFWHAGNCSCSVFPWSPDGPLELEELQSAPTWAVLKNIPPQLYSLEGISVIASAIGEPLHTEKSRLDPINIGLTKVKVIIQLDTTLPSTVVVRDIQGNSARVAVEYPRPPPKCVNCGRFGHLLSRCPKPLMKKSPFKKNVPSGSKEVTHPTVTLPSSQVPSVKDIPELVSITSPRLSKPKRHRSRSKKRSKSTPPRIYEGVKVSGTSLKLLGSSIPAAKGSSPSLAVGKVTLSASSAHATVPSSKVLPSKASDKSVLVNVSAPAIAAAAKQVPGLPVFSPPPGWGAMSTKTQKKLRQKWRNSCNSSATHVAVRGEASSSAGQSLEA